MGEALIRELPPITVGDSGVTPFRFQQRRAKGWRMPDGGKCVSRPSRWGNPFNWQEHDRAWAVAQYRAVLLGDQDQARRVLGHDIADVRTHLRGRPLGCYCPLGELCHADVLLEVASGTP